ncbi:hypothetical protein pdul_cds_503 [Pandoravirus dulcis]|uniref:Uncharacterized protein n=1 Tax=Pandoravirus dulcis TaxID=1349409 RepID=S4VT57_9VIRU|nr:hypothetical protein pdul_cds_503 [Pandoravirus dulcis]AGO82590.1 hypothetical protein pdul_cds_503 [Pandoravirus dulcis]
MSTRGAPHGAGLIVRVLAAIVGLLATLVATSYCAAATDYPVPCRLLSVPSAMARRRQRQSDALGRLLAGPAQRGRRRAVSPPIFG